MKCLSVFKFADLLIDLVYLEVYRVFNGFLYSEPVVAVERFAYSICIIEDTSEVSPPAISLNGFS